MGEKLYPKTIWQLNNGINKAGKWIFLGFRDFCGIKLAVILWNLVLYGYAVTWLEI